MNQDLCELSDLQRFDQFMSEYASERLSWRTPGPEGTCFKSGIALMVLFLVSLMVTLPAAVHIVTGCLLLLSGFGLTTAGAIQWTCSRRSELRLLVEQTQDTRLIAPLVSLASGSKSDARDTFRSEARSGLLRLLPLIQVEDAQKLDTLQWKWLYYQLQGNDIALERAILQAIMRCGRFQALRYVEPLAQGKGLAKREAGLQHLALSCVQQLQEQIDHLYAPQSLLRASALPGSKELLRPAAETVDTTPHQLLRAAEKQGDVKE